MMTVVLGAVCLANPGKATPEAPINQARGWSLADQAWLLRSQIREEFPNPRFMRLPLDHQNPAAGSFPFLAFSPRPFDPKLKTVLFVNGGPGSLASPESLEDNFGSNVNLIHFHVRGAGGSRIPPQNRFDKFLTLNQIIQDIEALRRHYNIATFDLVYGVSFGTLVAHYYTHHFPARVNLLGLHGVTNPPVAPELYYSIVPIVTKALLESRPSLQGLLTPTEQAYFFEYLQSMVKNINEFALDLTSLASGRASPIPAQLKDSPWLGFGQAFISAFQMLNYLGADGSLADLRELQEAAVIVLIDGVFKTLQRPLPDETVAKSIKHYSHYSVISAPDLRYPSFGYRSFQAISESTQDFDPASFPHFQPTIIFNGGLDGATTMTEARNYAQRSALGKRWYVEFPRAGHFLVSTAEGMQRFWHRILEEPNHLNVGKTIERLIESENLDAKLYTSKLARPTTVEVGACPTILLSRL